MGTQLEDKGKADETSRRNRSLSSVYVRLNNIDPSLRSFDYSVFFTALGHI